MLYMHTSIAVYRGRKTASEHLELELQAVASQSCGPWEHTWDPLLE